MYGNKLFLTGLFLLLAAGRLFSLPAVEIVGAVFMLIGTVLIWIDR